MTISPRGLGRGPSAGLAFTLEVYDALTGHAGQRPAHRGDWDDRPDGNVGEIGGVHQKVIGAARKGADLVLVPLGNAADARAAADRGASRSCRSARSARRSRRSAWKPF